MKTAKWRDVTHCCSKLHCSNYPWPCPLCFYSSLPRGIPNSIEEATIVSLYDPANNDASRTLRLYLAGGRGVLQQAGCSSSRTLHRQFLRQQPHGR